MTKPQPEPEFSSHPLDPVLSRYFHAELPSPFPPCRAVTEGQRAVPAVRTRAKGVSGRAVLAVAAAVLLGVGLFLSAGFPGAAPIGPSAEPGVLPGSTADGKNLLPPLKKPGPMGETDLSPY